MNQQPACQLKAGPIALDWKGLLPIAMNNPRSNLVVAA